MERSDLGFAWSKKLTHTEIGSLCSTLFSLSERHEERTAVTNEVYLNVNYENSISKLMKCPCPPGLQWVGSGWVELPFCNIKEKWRQPWIRGLSPLSIDSTDLSSYVNPENLATSYQVTVFTSFGECHLKSSRLKLPKCTKRICFQGLGSLGSGFYRGTPRALRWSSPEGWT